MLLSASGLTVTNLAALLHINVADDSEGMTIALEAAADEIQQYVRVYDGIVFLVPAGLKRVILDLASQRYEHTNLSNSEKDGSLSFDWANEMTNLMNRLAPYRIIPGM